MITKLLTFSPPLLTKIDIDNILVAKNVKENQGGYNYFVDLIDNLYDEPFEISQNALILAPEEVLGNTSFSSHSTMLYDFMVFFVITIDEVQKQIHEKQMKLDFKKNNCDEQNFLIVNDLKIFVKNMNLFFREQSWYMKLWYSFQGLFIENSVKKCYNLEDLVGTVLKFDQKKRPSAEMVAEKMWDLEVRLNHGKPNDIVEIVFV